MCIRDKYIQGVGTTLLVTAMALALGIVLGSVVALVRVAHDQQRPNHRNPVPVSYTHLVGLIGQAYHLQQFPGALFRIRLFYPGQLHREADVLQDVYKRQAMWCLRPGCTASSGLSGERPDKT